MQTTKKTGGQVYAILAILLLIVTTTLGSIPIFVIGLMKLFPVKKWQDLCTRSIDAVVTMWLDFNNMYIKSLKNIQWDISGLNDFNSKEWYLVIANHQSWLDIVILQQVFNRKIPVLKFFIKDQLKWIPLLGFSWWAMGCPFMKRYSKEYLAKNPHKKGNDLIATQKAIEGFKRTPAAVMSFIEGTRFTPEKKRQQNSPHTYLLKPKAGGISFILSAMGSQLTSVLDVTIIYPQQQHSLWDFLSRRVDSIKVIIRQLPIPKEFTSIQVIEDSNTQNDFKEWLNQQWTTKDCLIASAK
ncbi:MAG: acyltransferase [Legionellales bacterium]